MFEKVRRSCFVRLLLLLLLIKCWPSWSFVVRCRRTKQIT